MPRGRPRLYSKRRQIPVSIEDSQLAALDRIHALGGYASRNDVVIEALDQFILRHDPDYIEAMIRENLAQRDALYELKQRVQAIGLQVDDRLATIIQRRRQMIQTRLPTDRPSVSQNLAFLRSHGVPEHDLQRYAELLAV